MKASEFARQWHSSDMVKFSLESPLAEGIEESTAAALKSFGLPKTAEPWLSFGESEPDDENTAAELKKLSLFPIGKLANGDIICIVKTNGRIVICDHEDISYMWALNSSLQALYESMSIFCEFMADVNKRNPKFSQNYKIPVGMLSELAKKLKKCDSGAYGNKGFWCVEVQALSE